MPASEDYYAAYCGMRDRNAKIILFEGINKDTGESDVDCIPKRSMVIAPIDETEEFFRRHKIKVRPPLNIPIYLYPMLKRDVHVTSGEDFKRFYLNRNGPRPIFAKPNDRLKEWASGVLTNHGLDSIMMDEIRDESEVLVSDVVEMLSEYRVFVDMGKIVGIKNYRGEFDIFPDMKYINRCFEIYEASGDHPVSYTLDFAVSAKGETTFVEANDAWSIGSYGLEYDVYTKLLIHRWLEIMRKENGIDYGTEVFK